MGKAHRRRRARTPTEARRRRLESDRRWRAEKKRLLAAGWLWIHTGGGTWLIPLRGRKRYPCDTSYENLKTGEVATFYCTPEAYFGPLRKLGKTKSIRPILAVPGVKLHSRGKPQRLQEEEWKALVAKRVRFPKPRARPQSLSSRSQVRSGRRVGRRSRTAPSARVQEARRRAT
jgi:hypothetical protein